jgi:hypothetical protein
MSLFLWGEQAACCGSLQRCSPLIPLVVEEIALLQLCELASCDGVLRPWRR